jgi:hypothetical protein
MEVANWRDTVFPSSQVVRYRLPFVPSSIDRVEELEDFAREPGAAQLGAENTTES